MQTEPLTQAVQLAGQLSLCHARRAGEITRRVAVPIPPDEECPVARLKRIQPAIDGFGNPAGFGSLFGLAVSRNAVVQFAEQGFDPGIPLLRMPPAV